MHPTPAQPPLLSPASAPPQRPRRRVWGWLLLLPAMALGLSVALLALTAANCLHLGGTPRVLRNAVVDALGRGGHRQVELRLGPWFFAVLRAGLHAVELEPQARTALAAVRAAQVGVYELGPAGGGADPAQCLPKLDAALARRGWDRVVTVRQRDELVAVYAPRDVGHGRTVEFCAVVLEGRQLVVASVRGDLQRCLELAGAPRLG